MSDCRTVTYFVPFIRQEASEIAHHLAAKISVFLCVMDLCSRRKADKTAWERLVEALQQLCYRYLPEVGLPWITLPAIRHIPIFASMVPYHEMLGIGMWFSTKRVPYPTYGKCLCAMFLVVFNYYVLISEAELMR